MGKARGSNPLNASIHHSADSAIGRLERHSASRQLVGGVLSLAIELLAWLGPALAFLYVYVGHFGANEASIRAHVALLGSVALVTVAIRLVLWRWAPVRLAKWLASLLLCGVIGVFIIYYLVVLVGLQSWGRVVTSHLIRNYAPQISDLLLANGLPVVGTLASLSGAFAIAVVMLALASSSRNWIRLIATRASRVRFGLAALVAVVVAAVQLTNYAGVPPIKDAEPVSLTLFPEQATRWLQNSSIDTFAHVDVAEDEARRSYDTRLLDHRRNVILIAGDALRQANMAIYGYDRPTTPFLSGLQGQGRLEMVYGMRSVCGESTCGLLATTRSKYVHEFSRRSFGLVEVLRLHGYRIDLLLGGDHTSFYGLKDAYGEVDSYFDGSQVTKQYANDDQIVVEKVAALPPWSGQPTMIQVHLMSTHALGLRQPNNEVFRPASNYTKLVALNGLSTPSALEVQEAVNFYDNGVLQLDKTVQNVVEMLEQKGYLNDALVIVTGDHGELLGEHGLFGHQRVLEPALSVPFVAIRYGYSGLPLLPRTLASQVDIAPTIAHDLGLAIPPTWSGAPLQAALNRTTLYFQQANWIGLYDASVETEILKFVRDLRSKTDAVFNLTVDPGEERSLIDELEPGRVAGLRAGALAPASASRGRGEQE